MGQNSKIEWTDATWNPVRGCSVVSEGCRNCYAMQVAARFSGKNPKTGEDLAYAGLAYRNSSGAHWTGKVRMVDAHLEDPIRWKRPRRIFVNSMSDLFHESLSETQIQNVFTVMEAAGHHVYQVLTKRPARMRDFVESFDSWLRYAADTTFAQRFPNIWLGVSVEDQRTADARIPLLLETPAAVRFISAEPLLGPVDLSGPLDNSLMRSTKGDWWTHHGAPQRLHWAIVGGESGHNARPLHPDWVRSLRDQCVAANVPFFFKQWGEWDGGGVFGSECDDPCGRDVVALPDGTLTGTVWEPGPHLLGGQTIHRVGKKAAGRRLDGREWNEFPEVKAVTV